MWLIASQKSLTNNKSQTLTIDPKIKLSTLNQSKPMYIKANSLQSLKSQGKFELILN